MNFSYVYLGESIAAMKEKEMSSYRYQNYICQPNPENDAEPDIKLNSSWRDQICDWSFSVVDHFKLSRETVAICMNIFDRYIATQGNRCTASKALLVSLTALYITIKIHEPKKIRLTTLAGLSRDQFEPREIELMEIKILVSLSWRVNPPTVVGYISHMIHFMFPQVHPSVRRDIFEVSRYLSELSVCDRFFMEFQPSSIAYAAVLNVTESICFSRLSPAHRSNFINALATEANMDHRAADVVAAQKRLKEKYMSSIGYHMQGKGKHALGMQPAQHDDVMPCCGGRAQSSSSIDSTMSSVNRASPSPRRTAIASVSSVCTSGRISIRQH